MANTVREYFRQAMATKDAYISSPVVRKTDNSITIMMGKYFTANGKEYVAYGGLAAETFSDLIKDVHYENNGIAFIMDKSTSDLITAAINAVGKGSEIAAATAESMKEVKDMSAQTAKIIAEIAGASQEQSESIKQISQ
ncbi:MAG: hypothetical protein E7422_11695, partial [Ruminococcaceae bacterium]|nr:hypothetical protein [Oscillospiraceae bacterium]